MFGATVVELSVIDTPEDVFDTVPSKAHVGDFAFAEQFFPCLQAPLARCIGGLSSPIVGDGIANHDNLGICGAIAADDCIVTFGPFVGVGLAALSEAFCPLRERFFGRRINQPSSSCFP